MSRPSMLPLKYRTLRTRSQTKLNGSPVSSAVRGAGGQRDRTGRRRRHRQCHCHRVRIVSWAGARSRHAWRIVIRPFQGPSWYLWSQWRFRWTRAPPAGAGSVPSGSRRDRARKSPGQPSSLLFRRPLHPRRRDAAGVTRLGPGVSSGNSTALPARHSAAESGDHLAHVLDGSGVSLDQSPEARRRRAGLPNGYGNGAGHRAATGSANPGLGAAAGRGSR